MKIRHIIRGTLVLSLGYILNALTPPLAGFMKPDFLLLFLFVALTHASSFKEAMLFGFVAAILASFTTMIPGGVVANFIDKIITTSVVYPLIIKFKTKSRFLQSIFISGLGTLISGLIFIYVIFGLVGDSDSITLLFSTVVIPTVIINTFSYYILIRLLHKTMLH